MAFLESWIRPTETVLTAEQVKALPLGAWVTIVKPDRRGECTRTRAHVVKSPRGKKLRSITLFDCCEYSIRDIPNRRFVVDQRDNEED